MHPSPLSRREFITTTSTAIAAVLANTACQAASAPPARWPIGCFNRPWTKWSYDVALDGIKAAGYRLTGLLSPTKDDPLIGSSAKPEYLAALKQKIAARGLTANMGALRPNLKLPLADAIADTQRQIANAQALGLRYALTFGVNRPQDYDSYFKIMANAAAFADERGIQVVLKPHGGGSGASDEILRAMKAVGHPNFKVWYDAGNIIFYTGKDPVKELEPIAEHVTGLCAKDCAKPRGEVMIQFGEGKVDFVGVFRTLKRAGFNGPIMVESCKIGDTPEQTTENARANRLFLEQALASV